MMTLVPTPPYLVEAQHQWDETGTTVLLLTAECGQENAYYFPEEEMVVMCAELLDRPALARFILNHEMGHAFMFQHGIPNSERGADELAILTSDIDETFAAAVWFMDQNEPAIPGDPHQADLDRAGSFICLADGLFEPDSATRQCRMYAESVAEHWARVVLMLP